MLYKELLLFKNILTKLSLTLTIIVSNKESLLIFFLKFSLFEIKKIYFFKIKII